MQHFFDDLLEHKSIMSYEFTEKLLKEIDYKEFEATCNIEKNKKPPMSIREMIHFEGIVILDDL